MATKTWSAWPDNPLWSWQVTRIIGLVDFGAANFTEVMEVVQRITPRDEESWHREWYRMGELVEAMARRGGAADNRVSARNCYSRATQYFRLSHFFLSSKDPRKLPTLHRMQDCFEAAGRYFAPPLEVVAIPYEGASSTATSCRRWMSRARRPPSFISTAPTRSRRRSTSPPAARPRSSATTSSCSTLLPFRNLLLCTRYFPVEKDPRAQKNKGHKDILRQKNTEQFDHVEHRVRAMLHSSSKT